MELKRRNKSKKWHIIRLSFLFLYIVWMVAYFRWGADLLYIALLKKPNTEHQQLALQIESAREEILKMPNLVDERYQQLTHAQELLIIEQNKIPGELNINNIIRTVVEVGNRWQVMVIPLRTTPPDTQIVNENYYSHWHIFISVSGNIQDIANFTCQII